MNLQNIFGAIESVLKSPVTTGIVEPAVKSAVGGIVASNPEVAAIPGAVKALGSLLHVAAQIDPQAQSIVEPAEGFLDELQTLFGAV
jgi:hypothetical protein